MAKLKKRAFQPIDDEEKELMTSIEADECQSMQEVTAEKKKAMDAARRTIRKDKRINLRLSEKDYRQIQIRAVEEGMPYQTLISSIVHKYLNGTLVPKR